MIQPDMRILGPGDEDALETFLLPRVETSMFLIGNMRAAGLIDTGRPLEGTYAAAFEDGTIKSVVAHFWNRVLIFQAPENTNALWQVAVRSSKRLIGGLIGPSDQVERARQALQLSDGRVQMDETEHLYRLSLSELRIPEPLASGRAVARRIAPHDVETVTRWDVAYEVAALGAEDCAELWEQCRQSTARSVRDGKTWVLEDQGCLVARSAFNTAIDEAVQVGGVWTPPELRRKGYGRSVVAASLIDARARGVETAILFTGQDNVPAQRAYQSLGFARIGSYRIVLLKTPIDWPSEPAG
jgi:GNAT superfamily N-acetyltransferase